MCMKHHLGGFWGSSWPDELGDIAEEAVDLLQLLLFTPAGWDCSGVVLPELSALKMKRSEN